jgi:hypothetical protein
MTEFFTEGRQVPQRPIEPHEIAAALEAICGSDDFKRSSRLTDLLRYIVTEEVEGRGPRLKAYSIATEVLGRKADFDPSSDSIVRVEMARLRIALKLYYASAELPPIVIDVPKGRYRPVFARAADGADAPARPIERTAQLPESLQATLLAAPGRPVPAWRRAVSPVMLFASFIVAIGMMMGTFLVMSQPKEPSERLPPLVLVAPVRIASADAQITGLGLTLQGFLVSEIANDPMLSVGYLVDDRQDLSRNAHENRAVYLLSVSIVTDSERWSVSANLQDSRNRTVLWSRSETLVAAQTDSLAWAYELSKQLAAGIGDPFGIVARNELALASDRLPASRLCLIGLRQSHITWTADSMRRFVECAARLQNSRENESALALALMARGNYTAARWLGEQEAGPKLEAAWRQIGRAQATEPQLYLVETTAIRLAACRNDDAAVERLLRTFVNRRPNSPQAMLEAAYLSAYMLNDLPAADRLREQGRRLALNPQPTEVLTPALKAFQQGDMGEVVAQLKQSSNPTHPAKNVLWLVASAALRDDAAFRSATARLGESGYHTPDAIVGIVANSCWNAQIKADLAAALRIALGMGQDRAL